MHKFFSARTNSVHRHSSAPVSRSCERSYSLHHFPGGHCHLYHTCTKEPKERYDKWTVGQWVNYTIILLVGTIIIMLLFCAGAHSNVEDLRVSSVAHNLTPNPIYDGPLYETISDAAAPRSLRLKPKPLTLPPPPLPPSSSLSSARKEPKYTDSPTVGQFKLPRHVSEYEEPKGCKKETEEDCYIQMHTSIRHWPIWLLLISKLVVYQRSVTVIYSVLESSIIHQCKIPALRLTRARPHACAAMRANPP